MENHYPEIDQACEEIAKQIMPLQRINIDGVALFPEN
jgi:ribosomal protein S3AE